MCSTARFLFRNLLRDRLRCKCRKATLGLILMQSYYRSGTLNSNTVNSKFHLIRSYCEIFTGRNEVVAKVMFLHVSVILLTGGWVGVSGEPPPGTKETPPGTRQTPRTRQTPPGPRRTPRREEHCSILPMSGRYASYWNAFLFSIIFLTFHV